MLFENLSGAIWELWSHDSNNTFFWRIDSFSLYNFRILSIKYLVNCKSPLPSKCNPLLFSWLLFMFPFSIMSIYNSSVIGQKDESQKGGFKKTKHAKFSEKRTFLTLWSTGPYLSVFSLNAKNSYQKISEYGHFSRSDTFCFMKWYHHYIL